MKKVFLILVLAIVSAGCSEEIVRNSPSLQGLKDGVLWRAGGSSATVGINNNLEISGAKQLESLTLKTVSTAPQTYQLGTSSGNQVIFTTTNGFDEVTYSTSAGRGDGEITISEYDQEEGTVTGTFRFNAINDADDTENDVLNFQSGVFYRVPIMVNITDEP